MKKNHFLFLLTICFISTSFAQDFSVFLQVKTNSRSDKFPSISTNKQWDNFPVIDLISTSNMGLTLESGKNSGWSIFMQPNGAWGWNIGDGKNRLDYLPTTKQQINDGNWHAIGLSFYFDKKTVWLYFDNKHVAIYSLSELNLTKEILTQKIEFTSNSAIKIKKESLGKISIVSDNSDTNYLKTSPDKLTVMGWNIWHGARHNGTKKGIDQAIEAIRSSGAALVCMQETYGSGPAISDALGTLFYYRSSNLSVHSKYPIVDTYDAYKPFRFGGVRVKMGAQLLDVFSLWIHYLPSISKLYPTAPVKKILEEENKTRGKEIQEILTSLEKIGIDGKEVPLIIGGDFNSPSHLDWGEDMRKFHSEYVIKWPVSSSMIEAGFTDSFRQMAPNPEYSRGNTWSPRFHKSMQQRIDYQYYKGNITCVNSYVKGYTDSEWSSDHAAVVSEYRLK